ncbi:PREDICTED: oviduct-specific glycoprotein [Chrysochloris asiatica]|uniref:Oviduct-specific glycoprotein n=1 Tax=Chrysochloris asiatica TaxID=185453 RepID=A0A9B0WSX2_CHRAS|nr:PREDICTED: oviduct-specific glycoprotein [Chrysochloris asiatica]
MRRLLLWVGLVLGLAHHNDAAHKLVCYFTNWAYSRPNTASILPQDLDPFLCTHLIFAFASMKDNQIIAKNAQDENIFYPEFNKLKERNRKLKTLLSVGGWDFGTPRFTAMLSTSLRREKFIDSVISLLRTYNFDGLDLFFLYPGLRGSPIHDRWNFLFLIEELMFAFKKEAINNFHPKLLLSAAVSGVPHIIQTSYDVRLLGRCLDFISILSYDFHGPWEKFTGHNSPLFSWPGDSKSSAYAMNYWRKLGAPSEKLIMGLPTYGRTYCLLKTSETWLGAMATGPAPPGKYTKQSGFLAYFEICNFVQRAKKRWIDNQFVPYAYQGKKWIGYDDASSFSYKALFIKREHFGGAMVWTLDLDDVKGTFCGNGPFPLVHILKNLLMKNKFSSTPSSRFFFPPSGEEIEATDSQRKYESMITNATVITRREVMMLGKCNVTLTKKTLTPVVHLAVIPGEMALSPKHHLTVSPERTIMTPANFQTETSGEMAVTSTRKSIDSERATVPLGRMAVTSDEQTKILRGENLTSKTEAEDIILSSGSVIQLPGNFLLAFDSLFVSIHRNDSFVNSMTLPAILLFLKKENPSKILAANQGS